MPILHCQDSCELELFLWKTAFNKDCLEVCLPNSRLLSDLIGIWSFMKITLYQIKLNKKINPKNKCLAGQ